MDLGLKHHQVSYMQCLSRVDSYHYSITKDRDSGPTTLQDRDESQRKCNNIISIREFIAWVLVVILGVLFTGLLSVVLLWMFKKRQARDTSTDNTTPKYEMEGNSCYKATVVKQTTDTHLYEAVRGGGAM